MKTWFTSDSHLGHKRILELTKRPFASVEEMDEAIIERWNERVAQEDTVYHVGDFAFAEHNLYLPRLNGHKILILGNHDHKNRVKKAVGWHSIHEILKVKVDEQSIILCHYGMRVWRNSHHGYLHFYGHSHGNLGGDSQSLDVGVDCWDFRPVSLEEIRERLATLPPRVHPDHHQENIDG